MSEHLETLAGALRQRFGAKARAVTLACNEVTLDVAAADLLEVATALRDEEALHFEQMTDLCGVDYLQYGNDEWATTESSSVGFSRGVDSTNFGRLVFGDEVKRTDSGRPRFASVIHLISYRNNQRLRLRCYCEDDDAPVVPSVVGIWSSANWYERESFDLFGILYDGHADLRRLLTDYGFVGHPFRKDFPLVGHVEMRYDPVKQRVVYEPVSIEPRVLVPRVIRPPRAKDPMPADKPAAEGQSNG